jgi:hypothetical protein
MVSRLIQIGVVLGLIGLMVFVGYHVYDQGEPLCDICHRPIHQANGYTIQLESGETIQACCPRCGLRFQLGRTDVVATWTVDYPTGETLDAADAFYVENSTVNLCRLHDELLHRDAQGGQYDLDWDRCEPGLIAFRLREDAAAFIRANGGELRTYRQLLAEPF